MTSCPFCKSEIHPEATVCPTCRRDVYLFKPLLSRIEALESEVRNLNNELNLLKTNAIDDEVLAGKSESEQVPCTSVTGRSILQRSMEVLLWLTLPLLLLLLTHWLLVFVYDVRLLILRLVVLLIPLPFGFLIAKRTATPMLIGCLLAMGMASLAVVGMSAITSHIDQTPLWPQSFVEWKELIEFALSIAFSAITGLWIGHTQLKNNHRTVTGNWAVAAVRQLDLKGMDSDSLKNTAKRLEELVNTAVMVGTTGISIYTGLKGIVGD